MFGSFSWSNYFFFVATVLFGYFIVLAIFYYGKEVRKIFSVKDKALQQIIEAPVDRLPMVHELVSELGLLIRGAGDNNTLSPELYFAVSQALKKYQLLAQTEYKEKINEYIVEEMKRSLDYQFSEDQIAHLWNE